MPNIVPPGGEVDWPKDEGTLGVVGVAPWATMEFCRVFYAGIQARKDWHYPRVLLDINTKLPSRGRHLELGETDPSPYIAQTIAELAQRGATVVVVPCNTAHILFSRWSAGAQVHLPNIIEETVKAGLVAGGKRIVTLSSTGLARAGIYAQTITACGAEPIGLGAQEQQRVSDAIESVKQHGGIREAIRTPLLAMAKAWHQEGADTILLGCTELTELKPVLQQIGFIVVDSNEALASAAAAKMHLSHSVVS